MRTPGLSTLNIIELKVILRQLSETLKLIGSAIFGATLNLVTRVGPVFLE